MTGAGKTWPWPNIAGIFLESMTPSFKGKGDAMPPGDLYGTRTKYIHSVGVVAQCEFVPKSSGYTGMFKKADHGYIRLSSAA